VLHDLNHAARYATHMIAMRDGRVVAAGPPKEIVTAELIHEVFQLPCRVIDDPETGTPLVIPAARRRAVPEREGAPGPSGRGAAEGAVPSPQDTEHLARAVA